MKSKYLRIPLLIFATFTLSACSQPISHLPITTDELATTPAPSITPTADEQSPSSLNYVPCDVLLANADLYNFNPNLTLVKSASPVTSSTSNARFSNTNTVCTIVNQTSNKKISLTAVELTSSQSSEEVTRVKSSETERIPLAAKDVYATSFVRTGNVTSSEVITKSRSIFIVSDTLLTPTDIGEFVDGCLLR